VPSACFVLLLHNELKWVRIRSGDLRQVSHAKVYVIKRVITMAERAENPSGEETMGEGSQKYTELIEDPAKAEAMAHAANPDMTRAAEHQHSADNPYERAATIEQDGKVIGMTGVAEVAKEQFRADSARSSADLMADRAGSLYDTQVHDPAKAEAMAHAANPGMTEAAEHQDNVDNPLKNALTIERDGKVIGMSGVPNIPREQFLADASRHDADYVAEKAGDEYDAENPKK
jgi:hypothetical protein